MAKKKLVSERIDKLTNSIENAITGEVFDTEFHRLVDTGVKHLVKKDWEFDWSEEIRAEVKEVYKLTIKGNSNIIQGLLSLQVNQDHVFVFLVESAKFNRGKKKIYLGVLGNLFAYACKRSLEEGLGGFVAYEAKTNLVEHFIEELEAIQIGKQRMYIGNPQAIKLIERYFNS